MMRNLIGKRKTAFLNSSPGPFSYKEKGSVWESISLGKVPLFLREGFRVSSFYSTLLLLTIILFTGCGSNENPNPQETKKDPPKLVKVTEAKLKTLHEVLEITGTTEPENTANIISNVEGKITRLNVREGDYVKEGQIVVRISPMLREDVVTAAKIKVESLEEELKNDTNNKELNEKLKEAKENYEFALEQYKEISIVSPSSGIVSKRLIDLGDMVAAKSKILEITSSNRFKINLTVAETDLRKLKSGQKAELNLDACPDRKFTGTITRVYPEIDPLTRNGIVEVRLDNPCPNVKSGMFVRASFTTKVYKDVLSVPAQSIITKMENKIVFIIDENMKAKSVEVQTGFETKEDVEIVSGLKQGDKVVIDGQQTLKNGNEVKIQQDKKEMKK
jgi:membrane fusion protein (multidrug efflux system)